MQLKRYRGIWAALSAMAVGQAAIQSFMLPLWDKNYRPKGQVSGALSPDQMLLAVAGLREMIASILWVRADAFFDQGNYDAILPIIRIVTWLDPKQIDVFSTGMWHIGYNFTDEQSRSDRRYLPSALALGAEGARNNPETYEMFFETGWTWYHKVNDNYEKAVQWFREAEKRKDILPARRNILGMAEQRNGNLDAALKLYYEQYDKANEAMKDSLEYNVRAQRDVNESNIDNTLVRMSQRGYFASTKNLPRTSVPYDTEPPFNVGFSVQVTIPEPSQLRIRATWNVRPVGTRIKVVLKDADYPNAVPAGMVWDGANDVLLDPPKDLTYMQDDNLFIKNRRADKTIDLSRDPTMYPMTKESYVLEFYYNPRSAPPHIQDKFSWNGEGMTADPMFINTKIRPGQKVIYYKMDLTRDMIQRLGEWADKTPVLKSPNFVEPKQRASDDLIIQVPGLLDESSKK